MDNIYHLELHERMELEATIWVMRVPDGWIYEYYRFTRRNGASTKQIEMISAVFVPEVKEVQYEEED